MEGQRILVTRNFDKTDVIGFIQLRPGVEILPDTHFALGYTVVEKSGNTPTKIHVHEVSLCASEPYKPSTSTSTEIED
jgi:hypothetical protein